MPHTKLLTGKEKHVCRETVGGSAWLQCKCTGVTCRCFGMARAQSVAGWQAIRLDRRVAAQGSYVPGK